MCRYKLATRQQNHLSENIAKIFKGATFWLTLYIIVTLNDKLVHNNNVFVAEHQLSRPIIGDSEAGHFRDRNETEDVPVRLRKEQLLSDRSRKVFCLTSVFFWHPSIR